MLRHDPYAIEKRFGLRNPIYRETASYGHMGRQPMTVTKTFHSKYEKPFTRTVELFTWEKLDAVPAVKKPSELIEHSTSVFQPDLRRNTD